MAAVRDYENHFCHDFGDGLIAIRHLFFLDFRHGEMVKMAKKIRHFSPFLLHIPKNRWRNGNEPPIALKFWYHNDNLLLWVVGYFMRL